MLLVLCVGLIGTALLCAEDVERATSRYLFLSPSQGGLLLAGRLLGGTLAALLALLPAVLICLWTHVIAPPEEHSSALLAIFIATAGCAAGLGAMLLARSSAEHERWRWPLPCSRPTCFFSAAGLPPSPSSRLVARVERRVPMRYAIDGMRQSLFYPTLYGVNHDLQMLCGTALLTLLARRICSPRLGTTLK